MVSKEDYEKLFNEIFGTSIKWSKLSMHELTQLATVLANPEPLIKKLMSNKGEPSGNVIEALRTILSNIDYEGPIINMLRRYLKIEKKPTPGEKA
jgi:hypothetical protein